MNSPVARVFAVFSLVLAVVAVLFNVYVLVSTPDPAPATSASVVAVPVPAPVDTTSTAVPFPPPDDFDLDLRSRQASWCIHRGGVPVMTFTHDKSNVLCLKPEAIITLPTDLRASK